MTYVHEASVMIRETHLDVFGHVNNATYLQLYEEARWDFITQRGFGLEEIRRTQTGPVILEARVRFMRELRNRDEVVITSQTLKYAGKIGELQQRMLKRDGAVASEAIFVVGLMDLVARRLIRPTPEWANALGLPVGEETEAGSSAPVGAP